MVKIINNVYIIYMKRGIIMVVNLRGRSFLKLLDFILEEIRYLLDLFKELKLLKRIGMLYDKLKGKNIVLLFEKILIRIRCFFEVVGRDLGFGVIYLDLVGL